MSKLIAIFISIVFFFIIACDGDSLKEKIAKHNDKADNPHGAENFRTVQNKDTVLQKYLDSIIREPLDNVQAVKERVINDFISSMKKRLVLSKDGSINAEKEVRLLVTEITEARKDDRDWEIEDIVTYIMKRVSINNE